MGFIHELGEEYRYFRSRNPRLRWLFLLGDLAGLLVKLALFAGFMYLLWYVVNRNPVQGQGETIDAAPVASIPELTADIPELTAERVALLEKIASRGAVAASGLLGSVESESVTAASANITSGISEVVSSQSAEPVVQVESRPGIAATLGYIEVDEIPTVFSAAGETEERFFQPTAPTESLDWVLNQSAEDYTLQLAVTVNVSFLSGFSRRLPKEHITAIYPERRNTNNNVQYSLSLGRFPDLQSAQDALASMPNSLKRYGAHARKFDDIQKNLRALFVR